MVWLTDSALTNGVGRWSIHVHLPEGTWVLWTQGFWPSPANVRSITIMAVHLWLRAETKPNERRTHITPERCKDLVQAGKDANVLISAGNNMEVKNFLKTV